MSETMSEYIYIVCQGGDHSKKVIYAFFPPPKSKNFSKVLSGVVRDFNQFDSDILNFI